MKKCSLCWNKVHEDDLMGVISPMDGVYTNVCPTCISNLDNAFHDQVRKIVEYSKLRKENENKPSNGI